MIEKYKPEVRLQKVHLFIQQRAMLGTRLEGKSRRGVCPFRTELPLELPHPNWCTWAMAGRTQRK